MNVSVLIPTRGDRPHFLSNAVRLISDQTVQPAHIEIVDDVPADPAKKDITWRYRVGCERILAANPHTDVILFIEDDDWYHATYVETMCKGWDHAGRPDVYGIGDTTYYHLGLRAWQHQAHPNRASAMSTLLSASGVRSMRWPDDNYVFTDIEIWKKLVGRTFVPQNPLAIGIKGYKEGALFGGMGHNPNTAVYGRNQDPDLTWLCSKIDSVSYEFYKSVADRLR